MISGEASSPPRRVALIPAGGGGSRFGSELPKQYADLAGMPMIRRTIDRLATALGLAAIYVAVAPDDASYDARVGSVSQVRLLRCGGATRAATVANALAIIATTIGADDWVLVHDAARPCVPVDALQRLVQELDGDPVGGLLAIPAADTLKRADGAAPPRVARTEDRAAVWYAQTPQMFRCGLLRSALATDEALAATDEAQAIETLAARGECAWPRLVRGSAQNIKVTYLDDLRLAAAILSIQERTA